MRPSRVAEDRVQKRLFSRVNTLHHKRCTVVLMSDPGPSIRQSPYSGGIQAILIPPAEIEAPLRKPRQAKGVYPMIEILLPPMVGIDDTKNGEILHRDLL